jgi:protease PrsW
MSTNPAINGSVARALVGSPLRKPVFGCLFILALHVLLAIAFFGHYLIWISEPLPAMTIFGGTIIAATIMSIPALALLWFLDRRERESIWLFGSAVIWGGVISTGLSAIFNALGAGFVTIGLDIVAGIQNENASDILTAAIVAPFVEESGKGLAVLVLLWFLRAEFDNLRDGIIYGALVGLGFNIAEVALYVMKGYLDSGVAPFGEQFAARFVFLGLNGHLLWSALCGAGIGIARQTTSGCLRWFAPIAGYAFAVFGHMLHNSVGVFFLAILLYLMNYDLATIQSVPASAMWFAAAIMNIVVQGFSYLVLAILLYLSAQWERAIIRLYLADEQASGVVTAEEYSEISRDRIFFGSQRLARTASKYASHIANAQNELAFRKWHLARDGGDPASDPLVAAWRQDIMQHRQMG